MPPVMLRLVALLVALCPGAYAQKCGCASWSFSDPEMPNSVLCTRLKTFSYNTCIPKLVVDAAGDDDIPWNDGFAIAGAMLNTEANCVGNLNKLALWVGASISMDLKQEDVLPGICERIGGTTNEKWCAKDGDWCAVLEAEITNDIKIKRECQVDSDCTEFGMLNFEALSFEPQYQCATHTREVMDTSPWKICEDKGITEEDQCNKYGCCEWSGSGGSPPQCVTDQLTTVSDSCSCFGKQCCTNIQYQLLKMCPGADRDRVATTVLFPIAISPSVRGCIHR